MRQVLAAALLTLLWSPVTIDCEGGPESGVLYEFSYVWFACDPAGQDDPAPCAIFAVRFMTDQVAWQTAIGNPDPPVGSGYWYQVRARDGAGNWSDACPDTSPGG